MNYKYAIGGSGPAGLGCAFNLLDNNVKGSDILIIDKEIYCTGGMRNDCKMNFSARVGFNDLWSDEQINHYLNKVKTKLQPTIFSKSNVETYQKRAERLGCELAVVEQTHLGTDGGLELIKRLYKELEDKQVNFKLGCEVVDIKDNYIEIIENNIPQIINYEKILVAPGRKGFSFLQDIMKELSIPYIDNIVDIGVRVETKLEHYPIVKDYYDPKFYFPNKVRTFCTNSGNAHVVKEKYDGFFCVNGHAYAKNENKDNGLVNFAMLKTIKLTDPLASGSEYAETLGKMACKLGGNKPIMQRVGDMRLGHRSHKETFNEDLYDFKPTLNCTPGDITLAMPSRIFDDIWSAMKNLDTIVPGILHPSTIIYYPEIKFYANKPQYIDEFFKVKDNIWFAGDGAGTSRGITAAWASGIRASEGMLK